MYLANTAEVIEDDVNINERETMVIMLTSDCADDW